MRNRSFGPLARVAILTASCLLAAAATRAETAEQREAAVKAAFIGNTYSQLPTRSFGGSLAGEREGRQYAIEHVAYFDDEMIWLEVRVVSERPGKPLWRVVDVLILPPPSERKGLELCVCEGRDHCAAALYEPDGNKGPHVCRRAWRANLETEKFEAMPAEKAFCGVPGD
jgi:hypothetical protein